jgi:transcriptional regulator with XRE-family HTH domain
MKKRNGNVVCFHGFGHKSGRNSDRETPVSRSIGNTNSAGTPRLDRVSQYQTCDCVVPIRSAKEAWLPANSQARRRASVMPEEYQSFGKSQPTNLLRTINLILGKVPLMEPTVDKKALGQRVRQRREELGMVQSQVAKLAGMKQQGIGSIENGKVERVRRIFELARALETSHDWLLFERGPKEILPEDWTDEKLFAAIRRLSPEKRRAIIRLLKTA